VVIQNGANAIRTAVGEIYQLFTNAKWNRCVYNCTLQTTVAVDTSGIDIPIIDKGYTKDRTFITQNGGWLYHKMSGVFKYVQNMYL
jgi:hypothetical protein